MKEKGKRKKGKKEQRERKKHEIETFSPRLREVRRIDDDRSSRSERSCVKETFSFKFG